MTQSPSLWKVKRLSTSPCCSSSAGVRGETIVSGEDQAQVGSSHGGINATMCGS